MWSPPRSASPGAALRRQAGFTLVELMVGVLLGLLASLAVTHVLVNSEGQKRATTSGSDAQINGALALHTLQRALQPAGYGFASNTAVIGCTLTAVFNGAPIAATLPDFPTVLAPVVITDGAGDMPDTLRVLASGKASYSIPLRVVSPGYVAGDATSGIRFPVATVRGIEGRDVDAAGVQTGPGDLVVAAVNSTQPCELFEVTAHPASLPEVARADTAGWNMSATPAQNFGDGSLLINLGEPVDVTYSIVDNALRARTLRIAANSTPSYDGPVELYPNVVNLQAFYGKDTNADGNVDTWDTVTPATNAGWRQLVAVRVAVVARSAQFEKENVTHENPQWDVGMAGTFPAATGCGGSRCVTLKVDHLDDWQRYRYRVFDTVVPLRNMLWSSS